MAEIFKLEGQTEVKCKADKFFEIFTCKSYLFPKICPEKIKSVQVLEGDWATIGSVKVWNYVPGVSESGKERIEAIDVDNNSVTFNLLEGDILKVYKTFKCTLQVTNKDDGCLIKVTLAYEKQHEDTPPPTMYLDFVANISKDIEAYLFKAQDKAAEDSVS
ncbi:MLP-like protein 43 [Camellia lanceoleosa]|uniref:MLP-like protein 43 n=1 Tax=Camellia lanceoleosa TaxID=1840588 RepID=A0ACC0G0N8_9ERIC|nr:MLP-like protein 43 [Camellia lanceoleosa]